MMTDTALLDELKHEAALRALDDVRDGMTIGLGTGSTAAHFIRGLGERVAAGLRVRGVPTSTDTEAMARRLGIPLTTLDDVDRLDLTIDGADEIQLATFYTVKGRGGALVREKLVARATACEVLAIDETKVVTRLGERAHVPVEVVRFGWRQTRAALVALGAEPELRPAPPSNSGPARPDPGPFVTDNGNYILDCRFAAIDDPPALERAIKGIIGVVESGLFIGLVHRVVIATESGVQVLNRPTP